MTVRPTTDQITDLAEHAGRLREVLNAKRGQLTQLQPAWAEWTERQITALDGRVQEIEALCAAWQTPAD